MTNRYDSADAGYCRLVFGQTSYEHNGAKSGRCGVEALVGRIDIKRSIGKKAPATMTTVYRTSIKFVG
jgi:hypothetical protein